MTEIVCTSLTSLSAVLVALVYAKASITSKRVEERAEQRAKESLLSMELTSASLDLAYVTSLAVTGGHTNGNVEAAQKKAEKARDNYDKFLKEITAKTINK